MAGKCSTYGILVGKPEERDHLVDPVINWRKILRWIFRKWDGSKYRIDLAQDMGRRQAVVKVVMNLRVP
jgi:hypothetical protein